MPSRNATEGVVTDQLYAQIQRRLVESGEWDRIMRVLALKLNEAGWIDDLHHHAKELAREMFPVQARQLTEEITPKAIADVPENVKEYVTNIIRQYLDTQLEK
ncbi:hypothetical protein K474DRAFT_1662648 [Panus rudis PR-1116 ss-1]|nr:hypothetical protein K474DRAFT_1662648 [Panus rudis PR-1116 ss-1]